jgi:hypothetical protein
MNRLALLRYSILDACFASPEGTPKERLARGKGKDQEPGGNTLMFKEDLLDLVNKRLQEAIPGTKPIAMRTLEKDLVDMQRLYGVKIVKHSLHKRAWYSYATAGMSIRKGRLSSAESARLEGALAVLAKFQDVPGYAWVRGVEGRLRLAFGLVTPAGNASRKGTPGVWLDGETAWPAGAPWELLLSALAHGRWVEVEGEEGDTSFAFRPEALSEERGEVVFAGTASQKEGGWHRHVLRAGTIHSVREAGPVAGDAPAAGAWSYPLIEAIEGTIVEPQAAGEVVEMRIWFAGDALEACKNNPLPVEPTGKPEAASGGQILTFHLVPGGAWERQLWSFGPRAQLLEPMDIRARFAGDVDRMRAGYGKLFGP